MVKPVDEFQVQLHRLGYRDECICRDYSYFNPHGDGSANTIELAAFSQYPPTYREACIGVAAGRVADAAAASRHRSLGAPLVFIADDNTFSAWGMRAQEEPDCIVPPSPISELPRIFEANRDRWMPMAIRSARRPGQPHQLDFIDALLIPRLATEFRELLRTKLERAVERINASHREVHGEPIPETLQFPFLFRFVMAKVFQDRGDVPGWDVQDAKSLFEKAEQHCKSGLAGRLPQSVFHPKVLETVFAEIFGGLHFDNLALQDLFFIYENCFIDHRTRKSLGVHNTPLELANYIVEQLPFEAIPQQDRIVLEPFCGAGVFLAAAMSRLSALLPATWTALERHAYLQKSLIGIEKESLALEVCRMVLTLCDYPNPNGWQLYSEDVFSSDALESLGKRASIVLANPPFEQFSLDQKERYAPKRTGHAAEFLDRVLGNPPKALGLILPRTFVSSPEFRDYHKKLGATYGDVSLLELPDNTFHYARVETVALLASGFNNSTRVHVTCATVPKAALKAFFQDWATDDNRSHNFQVDDLGSLWIAPKAKIWGHLKAYDRLEQCVEIHKGVNFVARTDGKSKFAPRTDVVRDAPAEEYREGCEKMDGCLQQFRIEGTRYLSLRNGDQDPRTRAHKRDWHRPKAVCNAVRSREPWRIRAYADSVGLAFTKGYFACWPLAAEISVYSLAAVLCGPLANLYSTHHEHGRDNRIDVLRQLPVPKTEHLVVGQPIDQLSMHLHQLMETGTAANDVLVEATLRLDAAVLLAYQLPVEIETEILRAFDGTARPIALDFPDFLPNSLKEPLSLADFVTIKYGWPACDRRRAELIKKEFELELDAMEAEELDNLQRLAAIRTAFLMPLPIEQMEAYRRSLGLEN